MKKDISEAILKALKTLGIDVEKVNIEFTGDLSNGDYSSNTAFVAAKTAMTNPKDLAEKIVAELKKDILEGISDIKVAGVGFINFYLSKDRIAQSVVRSADGEISGGDTIQDKKIMVEYTDPNPFKVFHIGHLMSNAIGESISRLLEYSGAHIIRANWQGDVGPHVAKAIWGAMQLQKSGENENA
ncbi:MAG: arginine--tRNA ligase, partial [Patescibacteria group bacterium]|nr:arginine--tRNA ligase [Patescibacteria group bacterium]